MLFNFLFSRKSGVDVVDISRFKDILSSDDVFVLKVFSKYEIDYCFSYKSNSEHLAGIFAAKEAVSKAMGVKKYPFFEIEIRHNSDGSPEAWFKDKKLPIKISISHSNLVSVAIAIA